VTADGKMRCGHAVDWTGGGGEEEDRGRRGDKEMRRRGVEAYMYIYSPEMRGNRRRVTGGGEGKVSRRREARR
jgi:hypothetical protein